jgi:hypothetical protein
LESFFKGDFMHTTQELFKEAETLPVEDRVLLADSLLKTLNAPDPAVDKQWFHIAQNRLVDIKQGKIKAVSGEIVFKNIGKRFEQ